MHIVSGAIFTKQPRNKCRANLNKFQTAKFLVADAFCPQRDLMAKVVRKIQKIPATFVKKKGVIAILSMTSQRLINVEIYINLEIKTCTELA